MISDYFKKNKEFLKYFINTGYKVLLVLVPLGALIMFITFLLISIAIYKVGLDAATLETISKLDATELTKYVSTAGDWIQTFGIMMLMLVIYLLGAIILISNSQYHLIKSSIENEQITVKKSFASISIDIKRFSLWYLLIMVFLNVVVAFVLGLILPNIYFGAVIGATFIYLFTLIITRNKKISFDILLTGIILYVLFTAINLQIIVVVFLPIYFYYFNLKTN